MYINLHERHLQQAEYTMEDIDLQSEYDHWNQKLFKNKLPKIKLKWNSNKKSYGKAVSMINRKTNTVVSIEYIAMSKLFKYTYELFNGIFIHEMIHVYLKTLGLVQTSGRDKVHGHEFLEVRDKLQSMVDFKIPLSEDIGQIDINSANIKLKKMTILIFNTGRNIIRMSIGKDSTKLPYSEIESILDYRFGGSSRNLDIYWYSDIMDEDIQVNQKQIRKFDYKTKISGHGMTKDELQSFKDKHGLPTEIFSF